MENLDIHRVKELFLAASDLPPNERAGFLDAQADLDVPHREWVEGQLFQLENGRARLAPRGIRPARPEEFAEVDEERDEIERYKLLELIGEGGCGRVWMADQLEPVRRRVAIKVIKLGMDSKQVIARFEAERQALAMMDHPHIARIFDGGLTGAGRPFFAMELVRGLPITEYCDQNRLGIRERLELMAKVCQAVQHAHLKGVIHRDLKPSNVLITLQDGEAVPKVIDFGIAKATTVELTQRTLFTEFHQLIGTPEYMAPEQASWGAMDIDTRADVYALGVLLYELLTGTRPFDAQSLIRAGFHELLRVIREDDPPKPSTRLTTQSAAAGVTAHQSARTLRQMSLLVRGDLDWIVMKALEKPRARRYETADALAADIRRHLNDEPVDASPPSTRYRLGKFLRRNRRQAAAAAVLIVVVSLGVVISLGFALDARAERDTARAARSSLSSLVQVMKHASPFLSDDPRVDPIEALDQATELVKPAFVNDPLAEADVRKTIGAAYWRQGEIRAAVDQLNLAADLLEAHPSATAAELRSVLTPRNFMLGHLGVVGQEVRRPGRTHAALLELIAGDDAGLDRNLREVLSWAQAWRFPLDHESVEARWRLIESALQNEPPGSPRWSALGDMSLWYSAIGWGPGDWSDSLKWLDRAERIYLGPARLEPSHMMLAMVENLRLQVKFQAGRSDDVRESADRSLARFTPVLPESHWLLTLFRAWRAAASTGEQAPSPEALEAMRRSLAELERPLGGQHFLTNSLLASLVRNAERTGAADVAHLRDRLAGALDSAGNVPGLEALALMLDDEELMEQLRSLRRVLDGDAWTVELRAEVRELLTWILARSAEIDGPRRSVIARWLKSWSDLYIEYSARCGAQGGEPREDLVELYHFSLDALTPGSDQTRSRIQGDLSRYYWIVKRDRDRALHFARMSVRRDADGRLLGDGWSAVVLGLALRELGGQEEEALEVTRLGYERLCHTHLHIEVHVDYAHRHLMSAYVVARGAKAEPLREAAAIAVVHARELVRGGATAESLHLTSWAIVRASGLDRRAYAVAQDASRQSVALYDRMALEDDGPIVEALNTQALAEIRMGDWDAAYAAGARAMDLRDASGLEPSALNHLFLSQALRGRGQREAADEAFERAAMLRADDLSPPDPVAEALFEEAMEGSTGR
ncbi:MAG: serine/threonine-protein kinase [Planctomycetota bacterium]